MMYRAKVYLYTRPLEALQRKEDFTTHWGVVINYLDKDDEEHLPVRILYEANNESDLLWARIKNFKRSDEEIEEAKMVCLNNGEEMFVDKEKVKEFCQKWNQNYYKYDWKFKNCQTFACRLLKLLGLSANKSTFTNVAVGSGATIFVAASAIIGVISIFFK